MSLLSGPRRETRSDYPTSVLGELMSRRLPALYGRDGSVNVTADSSERLGAVFACRDLIARMGATLPLDVFTITGGVHTPVMPTVKFFETPDLRWQVDRVEWLYQILDSLLSVGNAFGCIEELDRQGYPSSIHLIPAGDVRVETHGYSSAEWYVNDKRVEMWPDGELWHIPAYTRPGCPLGISPLGMAAVTIGIGLSALYFGAQWFRDGAIPSGVLSTEKEVTQGAAELAKDRFLSALSRNREPVVLGNGWAYQQIAVAANESQFLETSKSNVADVCRFFGVAPENIGGSSGSSMTYSNVESRSLELYVRTLRPWCIRLERALSRLRPNGQYARFNIDALLRADSTTRTAVYDRAIRGGWLSVNDVRTLEDREPIEDGDRYLWPPGRAQLSMDELEQGVDSGDVPTPPAEPAPEPADEVLARNGHKETAHV